MRNGNLIVVILFLTGVAVFAEQPNPVKEKDSSAELLRSLQQADVIFTAKITAVMPSFQTNSIPPSIGGDIRFKEIKLLKGQTEATKFTYVYREGSPNMEVDSKGEVIVALKQTVLVVVPATEANLALVKKAEPKKK